MRGFAQVAEDTPTIPERSGAPAQPRERAAAPQSRERYVEVREIARGGMGRVVEAVDTRIQRTVALKEIIDGHPEARARFEREVEITGRLEHPSIVPLYDAGTADDGSPFYVMRKVSGDPLDTLIKRASTLDQRLRLLPNMLAVTDAVAHAHARQVIHRDLKPSNVLVGQLGETIVIDWGLAKLLGEREPDELAGAIPAATAGESLRTVAGTVFGTPGFMPPEQIAGKEADARADVFALGACLYYILGGRPAYRGASEEEIFAGTVAARRDPLPAGVPPDLVTIVDKAMAAEASDRYLDAGGLSEDLRRFLDGQLVAAHHYPLRTRALRWLRRHRAIVAVVTLALVLLTVGAVVSVRRILAERARAESAFARERMRTDELVVAHATSYLESNPTLAAASLAALRPEAPQWERLGSLLAEIQARGVAWGYPGTSSEVMQLMPAPRQGDERMLVGGRGIVTLIDLAARTSTTLAADSDVWNARWCGPLVWIARRGAKAELVDPGTGDRVTVPWSKAGIASSGLVVEVVTGRVQTYDLSRGLPVPSAVPVALPFAVTSAELSESGRWLVAGTDQGKFLLAIDGGRVSATAVPLGNASRLDFSATETRVAFRAPRAGVVGEFDLVELDLAVSPPRELRRLPVDPYETLHYAGDRLHTWRVDNHQLREVGAMPLTTPFATPWVAVGDRLAAITDDGDVLLTRDGERYRLTPPLPLTAIAAPIGGRYVVGAASSGVVAWDLTTFASTHSDIALGYQFGFIGARRLIIAGELIATGSERMAAREYEIDDQLAAHARAKHDTEVGFLHMTPTGVVVLYTRDATRVLVGAPPRFDARDVASATASSATTLLVGMRDGRVLAIDRASGAPTELGRAGSEISVIAAENGWLVALTTSGGLWRRSPSGATTTTTAAVATTFTVAPDGVTYFFHGGALYAWPVGGPAAQLALIPAVPRDVAALVATASGVAIATPTGGLYRFDRATALTTMLVAASRELYIGHTIAAALVDGEVVVIDVASGQRHRVIAGLHVQRNGLTLSPDERLLAAVEPVPGGGRLHVWQLEPGTRAALLESTNAVAPTSVRGPITWR